MEGLIGMGPDEATITSMDLSVKTCQMTILNFKGESGKLDKLGKEEKKNGEYLTIYHSYFFNNNVGSKLGKVG